MKSDEELLEQIRQGQDTLREVVDELSLRYADGILQICLYKLKRPQRDAEEVAQEVFMEAYRSMTRYEVRRGIEGLKPWLRGILENKCKEFFRKDSKRQEVSVAEIFDDPASAMMDAKEKEARSLKRIALAQAFMELDDSERFMIALRTNENLSFSTKEVGALFDGINEDTVNERVKKIMEKLKQRIEEIVRRRIGKIDGKDTDRRAGIQ